MIADTVQREGVGGHAAKEVDEPKLCFREKPILDKGGSSAPNGIGDPHASRSHIIDRDALTTTCLR